MKIEQILDDLKSEEEKAQHEAAYKEGVAAGIHFMRERIDNMTRLRLWKDEEHEAMQARIDELKAVLKRLKMMANTIPYKGEFSIVVENAVNEVLKADGGK